VQAFAASLLAIIVTTLLFHRFVGSSFDPQLSSILGLSPGRASSILLALTATVVVIAFQAVGALMTVALLVLPATTALLLKINIRFMLPAVTAFAITSSAAGLQLALSLNLNLGASIVLAGAGLFILALFISKIRLTNRTNQKH
jgi:ABC-type Mn2+/Zn2+ transport system permease subunit